MKFKIFRSGTHHWLFNDQSPALSPSRCEVCAARPPGTFDFDGALPSLTAWTFPHTHSLTFPHRHAVVIDDVRTEERGLSLFM